MGGAHSLAFLTFPLLTGWLAKRYGLASALRIAPGLTILGMIACAPLVLAGRRGTSSSGTSDP